jgi:hypothetical protein
MYSTFKEDILPSSMSTVCKKPIFYQIFAKICNTFLKIKLFHYGLGDRTLDALAKFLEDGGRKEQKDGKKEDGTKEEEDVVVEVEDEVMEVEDEEEPPKAKDEL